MNIRMWRVQAISILVFIGISLCPKLVYSQGKEANVWHFGEAAGLDFNMGTPPPVIESQLFAHGGYPASICDTNGIFMFSSNGDKTWNRNQGLMLNSGIIGGGSYGQSCIVVPKPESNGLYYLFHFRHSSFVDHPEFLYSLIDMDLDNGLGGVVLSEKDVFLVDKTNSGCLSAVKHANGTDIWVVTHERRQNHPYNYKYYAFLVTESGVSTDPVVSVTEMSISGSGASIRLSPNGKKLYASSPNDGAYFNLLDFDNESGTVSDTNQIVHFVDRAREAEFSPDNSKLYTKHNLLVQYDLNAGSNEDIIDSETVIGDVRGGLQLAPDGKIYLMETNYLNVIHFPNKKGEACGFEEEFIQLEIPQFGYGSFPLFIQSYLNDPTFTAQNFCLGDVTTFEIDDTNGIDSVLWKFNDFYNNPHDTSTLFNPTYTFTHIGTYYVDLTAYSGLIQKSVTQEVIINPIPDPDLGNDTLVCNTNFQITLNPNCDGSFLWNNFSTDPELVVTDTGTYRVRVTLNGCIQVDSIHIGLHPEPILDATAIQIDAADCGLPTGAIEGLIVNGVMPLEYFWINMAGDTVGINLNLLGQYAGRYALNVLDGNGCDHELSTFIIPDNGAQVVDSVLTTPDHCNQAQGTIAIFTDAPTPDTFEYSIDGVNFFQNQGQFTDLSAGSYHVTVKDANGCVGVYEHNPVVIDHLSGPQVSIVDIVPEDNNLVNGSINIQTTGGSGNLTYSIDNGGLFVQLNDGLFTNLSAGNYLCTVYDAFGCDTTFTVYVPKNMTQDLEAIAGFGNSCVEDAVLVPLELVNFSGVKSFVVTLYYHPNIVLCDGYVELNPVLELGDFQATVQQATGKIQLTWMGNVPITLPDEAKMLKLKFDGLGEGFSPVGWESSPGESHFYDENQQEINAAYSPGNITVYSLPEIQMQAVQQLCSGDTTTIDPTIFGGNGQKDYTWTGPNGFSSRDTLLCFDPITTHQEGSYTLLITDTMNCKKSQSVDLTVMESPVIAFSGYDTLFVEPGYLLDAGSDAQSYFWNTGATTAQIAIDTAGLYRVEAYTNQGCKASEAVNILWAGTSFYIPNAFTPNGDGLNDVFGAIPRIDYVNQYRISIFNRWGQLLFESTDLNLGWDGTYQGKACQAGAYVYRIVYNDFGMGSQETKVKSGTVLLVR